MLDNVINHPVWPGYGVHAVTVDGTCLDIAAMVPNTRWAITPYVEPPSASEPVVGNRHHLRVDGFRCEHGLCADYSMMDRGGHWRRYRRRQRDAMFGVIFDIVATLGHCQRSAAVLEQPAMDSSLHVR